MVGLAGANVEARAQGDARQIQSLIEPHARLGTRAAEYRDRQSGAVQPRVQRGRNVNRIVQAAAEGGAEFLLNPDHLKVDPAQFERAADGRRVREQAGADVLPDNADGLLDALLLIGEEAALRQRDVPQLRKGGGNTQNAGVLVNVAFVLHVFRALPVNAIEDLAAGDRFEILQVLGPDAPVLLELVEVLVAARGGGNLRDQVGLAAEDFGRALVGIGAQPLDGRSHHHHAGDTDDDAQQGQKAAQLVRADRIQRQPGSSDEVVAIAHHPRAQGLAGGRRGDPGLHGRVPSLPCRYDIHVKTIVSGIDHPSSRAPRCGQSPACRLESG